MKGLRLMNLKGRHFLTLKDYTPEEIQYLVDFSAYLKDKKKKGILVDELNTDERVRSNLGNF